MACLRLAPTMRTPSHTTRKLKREFQSSGESKEAVRSANRLMSDGSHLPRQVRCGRVEQLAGNVEMINPILLPALIVLVRAERLLFAVTDGLDAVRRYTLLQ